MCLLGSDHIKELENGFESLTRKAVGICAVLTIFLLLLFVVADLTTDLVRFSLLSNNFSRRQFGLGLTSLANCLFR